MSRPIPDYVDGLERRAWAREDARAEREAAKASRGDESPHDPFTSALVDEILNGDGKRRNKPLSEAVIEGLAELQRIAESRRTHPSQVRAEPHATNPQVGNRLTPVDADSPTGPMEAA